MQINMTLPQVKIRLNDQYLNLNQLKQQIGSLTIYKHASLEAYEALECEWFDKNKLFDKDNLLKNEVISMLRDIFYTHSSKDNKLRLEQAVKIFEKATNTPHIL